MQKAHEALRACLDSDNPEGLLAELKAPDMLAEARAWLDGESLSDLPLMHSFVGRLRFAFSVERSVEGEHAAIHHLLRKAPHHTVAYVSLNRRLPQMKLKLVEPSFFKGLSDVLESVRNPRLVVRELGLEGHPACAVACHPWDSVFGKVVYRSECACCCRALPGPGPGPGQRPARSRAACLPTTAAQSLAKLRLLGIIFQSNCTMRR